MRCFGGKWNILYLGSSELCGVLTHESASKRQRTPPNVFPKQLRAKTEVVVCTLS
jgi:hypothetical protein